MGARPGRSGPHGVRSQERGERLRAGDELQALGEVVLARRGGLTVENRWGMPDDVGRAVAMLARGDLAYSTGQVVLVDGGMTLGRL